MVEGSGKLGLVTAKLDKIDGFFKNLTKLNSLALVRERTIPTERSPKLVPTFADRGVSRGQR